MIVLSCDQALRSPGGVFAAWAYGHAYITPDIDAVSAKYYAATGPYWNSRVK